MLCPLIDERKIQNNPGADEKIILFFFLNVQVK